MNHRLRAVGVAVVSLLLVTRVLSTEFHDPYNHQLDKCNSGGEMSLRKSHLVNVTYEKYSLALEVRQHTREANDRATLFMRITELRITMQHQQSQVHASLDC